MKLSNDRIMIIIFTMVVVAAFAAILVLGSQQANQITQQKNVTTQALCPSETIYNSNTGKCEYTPSTQPICPSGTNYNSETEKCEYTPSTQAVCSSGTTYNSATDKCEYTPPVQAVCKTGFIYNSATDKCEYTPQTQNATTQSKSVTITRVIDPSCTRCLPLDLVVNSLRGAGVAIEKDVSIDYYSDEGRQLVSEYGIHSVPALILSKEIENYTFFMNTLPALNATHRNGNYMLQELRPPYRDIATGRINGLVNIVYLNDSTCSLCYNVLLHRRILEGYGISIVNETLLDISSTEGRALIGKYKITAVPTFLMSPDASYYKVLSTDWNAVGKVTDGWYIFTNMTAINSPYRNLENGIIVVPAG